MEASTGSLRYLLHLKKSVCLGAEPWRPASNECGCPGGNRCAAGRRFPELHQLDWQRHRSRRSWRRCRRRSCLLAERARRWPMACSSSWAVGSFRDNPVDRVLDHQWNRRREVNRGGTRQVRSRRAVQERRERNPAACQLPPRFHFELLCRRERKEEQWLSRNS